MTNFVWFLCANALIGIVILFVGTTIFVVTMCYKYGSSIVNEVFEQLAKSNEDTYAIHGNYLKVISAMVAIFLWEFVLPIVWYLIYQQIVELYNYRNRP